MGQVGERGEVVRCEGWATEVRWQGGKGGRQR